MKSFQVAFKGLGFTIFHQRNMRIHVIAAILVIITGFYFQVSNLEWCLLVVAIGMVLSAEIFNTVIENMMDFIHPDQHPEVGKIKDAAAGGVLIIAIAAFVVGVLVFWKFIFAAFQNA